MFSTDEYVVKINVQIAELIIDEFDDFAYFTAKAKSTSYGKKCKNCGILRDSSSNKCSDCGHEGAADVGWTYSWTIFWHDPTDMIWDGFYALAKNIDAKGQTSLARMYVP